jgi:putative transposase
MLKAHKIRLNPTPEQEQYFKQACGVARFCYNWGLAEWKRQYEAGGSPSAYSLKKQFNAIRREQFPWTYDVTKCSVDTGFLNLGAAFKNFFRRVKNGDAKQGYPRFKSKRRSKASFRLDRDRFKLDGHRLKVQKLSGWVNMTEPLRLEGEIGSATISRDSVGDWYISITVDVEPPEHEHERQSVGIDLGIATLATLSDGQRFDNQKPLRSELRKLRRLNRELARRQRGSGRWYRTKRKLARLHQRIKCRRQDHIHKMTTKTALTYQLIGVEDLNVAGMVKNHNLALSISDVAFGEIRRHLEYKAAWYGGQVVTVDRFFPSSKLCRKCGQIKTDFTLATRVFVCDCGHIEDRDLNASRNIEVEALRTVAVVASSRPKTHVDRTLVPCGQTWMKRELASVHFCTPER